MSCRPSRRFRPGSHADLWPAGVAAVFVSLMAGKAEVTYDPDVTGAGAVARLIEALGFCATVVEHAGTPGRLDLRVSVRFPQERRTRLTSATAFRSQGLLLRPQTGVQTGVYARRRGRLGQPGHQQRSAPLPARGGRSARPSGHHPGAGHAWTGPRSPQPGASPLLCSSRTSGSRLSWTSRA